MRQTLLIFVFLVQMVIASFSALAQSNYPIFVSPSLLPPYSLQLSDYSAHGSQRLMVTIVVNDLEVANLPVKLRLTMETAGATIETPVTLNTTPIYLDGGSATVLFGEDLYDYFNLNNLQFKGFSKEAYQRSGQMPEGFYRFSIEVLHFHTNRVISNTGTTSAWMALGHPPVLRLPANDAELGQYVGVPITFSWLSSNVGSPVSAGSIRYKFELWEVRVKGVNPYNIVGSMPVFYEHVTSTNSYSFNPASVMMEEGMTYAWRVTAFDESGLVPFSQNGQSEVRTFTYKSRCEAVSDISATAGGQKGSFVWTPEKNHTSFNVEVRNAATDWFSASETYDSKVEFFQLERGQTYELRVQAVCNGDAASVSDYSSWTSLLIPDKKPDESNDDCPDCACSDDLPDVELTNFELRQDLTVGDTLTNKTGTTRFIVREVNAQGNGIYSGVFYFWGELWGMKVPCEFSDLQVNTDNVIVNMDYKSINDPKFIVDIDALAGAGSDLLDQLATVTAKTSIVDTIAVQQEFDYVVVKDGELYAVVVEQDTVVERPMGVSLEEAKQKLITSADGGEVVISSKGEPMGVQEFKATGGNNRLVKSYNEQKEKEQLTEGSMVGFSPYDKQNYGFDAYDPLKQRIQHFYPSLDNGYRPAFKSVESFRYDKVLTDASSDISFRDEMGIPALSATGALNVQGHIAGSTRALYAYRALSDSTEEVVGKLNVVSFDNTLKRVHVVPVNGAKMPTQSQLEHTLKQVYKQAIATWTVVSEPGVSVHFPGGRMTHEGSGTFSTYNDDQTAIVDAYVATGRKIERGDLYLFFVEGATFKDRSLAGYMPLNRQVGFIYDNPSPIIVAHELGHGAFNLRHTFSPEEFIQDESKTQNLMDYAGGTDLWKYQWDLIHNPESILFAWAQDEEEGAAISMDLILRESSTQNIEFDIEGMITCLTPAGKPYTLPSNVQMLDFTSNSDDQPDGALFAFATDDNRIFSAAFRRSTKEFLGYAEIKRQSNNILDRIDYKDSEKKIPVLREDNLTKSLSDDSRVLIGKVINCAINVYQIEYAQVINKEGVQEDEYYGSGSFDNPISYNLQGKTPISVSDPTACFNAHAKKFYNGHMSASSSYKDVLLRIANLINSVEEQGDNVFADYEMYCRAERSERYYGSPEAWAPEYYELFANALEAYIESKDALEKIILAETNRDRVTDLAWTLVSKWSESISYDVRLHIIKKLSEGKMYGNPLFGNGQEYLAVRLISGIQNVEEQAKFLTDITKDDLLEVLFSRMGDELGGDNFSTFIMLLSQMAKNNIETFGVQGDPLFIWVGNLFRSDKVKIDFTTGSQLKVQGFTKEFTCYPTYYGGGTSCTSKWDTTTPEYTLSPFTFIPVKFPKGEKFLESLSDDGSNIAFVPVIYLKALNAKRNTDVTKTTVGIAVDVASLCIGIGELNAAIKAVKISKDAIKILRLTAMATDVVITSSDIIITLVEDDIRELEGGPEFLDKYRTYSALSGLTAFGGDVLTKSPETLAGLSDSWHKFKGTHGSNPKKVINAVGGTKGYHDIEKIVDETEDALRQTQHVLPPSSSLDVNAKYADAIAHIADDWRINALGRPISDLKEAPLGYYFYPKKNPEGLRRLDANDPKTPQLKVENGLVVVANKYAENLTGIIKTTCDELINAGIKHLDDGSSIKFLSANGDEIAAINNGKFTVKKWGAHYEGTVVKELGNGYWLVKNGDEHTIDLGFGERKSLNAEEVNEYLIKGQGKDADGQPYLNGTRIDEIILGKKDEVIYFVEDYNNGIPNPGQYASKNEISTIKELRENLAVKEAWKKAEKQPTIRAYRVKVPLKSRSGTVGPQIDNGKNLPGGGHQYEIVDFLGKDWKKYLEPVGNEGGIILK